MVERHYIFLKRLCQVLCSLGSQLCFLVVSLCTVFDYHHLFTILFYVCIFYIVLDDSVLCLYVFLMQGSDVEVDVPANLSKYTEAFLAFTTHPSQVSYLVLK